MFICGTLKGYLKNYARKIGLTLPTNYDTTLRNYCKRLQKSHVDSLCGMKIYFSSFICPFSVSKNLNASSIGKKGIKFDEYWANRIIFHQTPELFDAFCMTAGHELTHKTGEYRHITINRHNNILASWVREVRADFGGDQL